MELDVAVCEFAKLAPGDPLASCKLKLDVELTVGMLTVENE